MKNTYYSIQSWMLSRLELKSNDLLVFAIIYGFSMDGESKFKGSLKYLMNMTGASKPTVLKSLKFLIEKNFIIKQKIKISGLFVNDYSVNLDVISNFTPSKVSLPGVVKKLNEGSKETLPHNIIHNINNNKKGFFENEIEFLTVWNNARTACLKLPSNKNNLTPIEKREFNNIKNLYTIREFKDGLAGLFMNKAISGIMHLSPLHFLSDGRIENYIYAYKNKITNLYGENKKQTGLGI